MTVRASVLIPIHNKPTTLPLTVDTVLRQSVTELEVLLIGDGVTDHVRDAVEMLRGADERVRFLDFPKGQHHGERYRHDAIEAARSDAILYLCDDDLLLPDHVADLLGLLEEHTLVQSRNGWVTAAGALRFYATDLADPAAVALHLRDDVRYNAISITGTAHSRELYRAVADPWDVTPHGQWPDHHQFRKLLRHPGFRGATSGRMTALQFPTSVDGRETWTDDERLAELRPWHRLVTETGAQEKVDQLAAVGERAQLAEERQAMAVLSAGMERVLAHEHHQADVRDRLRELLDAEQASAADGWRLSAERLTLIEALQSRVAGLEARIARKNERLRRLRAERRALRTALARRHRWIPRARPPDPS